MKKNLSLLSALLVLAVFQPILGMESDSKSPQATEPLSPEQDLIASFGKALESNDIKKVTELLDAGVSVNARIQQPLIEYNGSIYYRSALAIAIEKGFFSLVELLIERGADLEAKDYSSTPLARAASCGELEIVTLLINKGANLHTKNYHNETPLFCALDGYGSDKKHFEVAQLLVNKGARLDVQGEYRETVLHRAVKKGKLEFVELFIKKGAEVNALASCNETPLHCLGASSYRDYTPIATLLLDEGASINAQDYFKKTPLHQVIERRSYNNNKETDNLVRLLIQRGADLNIPDDKGNTPLHKAATQRGVFAIIPLLLNNGAALNALNEKKQTPLDCAIAHGCFQEAVALLERDAQTNGGEQKDKSRLLDDLIAQTKKSLEELLEDAIRYENLNAARLLIQKGANVHYQKESGRSLLGYAIRFYPNHLEMITLLIESGANMCLPEDNYYGDSSLHCAADDSSGKNFSMVCAMLKSSITINWPSAWQKLKTLLVGVHKDANSPLHKLPQDIVLNILLYTPDCVANKSLFNKIVKTHCNGINEDAHQELAQHLYDVHKKDGILALKKLLECTNKGGDTVSSRLKWGYGSDSYEEHTKKREFLKPSNACVAYKALFSDLFGASVIDTFELPQVLKPTAQSAPEQKDIKKSITIQKVLRVPKLPHNNSNKLATPSYDIDNLSHDETEKLAMQAIENNDTELLEKLLAKQKKQPKQENFSWTEWAKKKFMEHPIAYSALAICMITYLRK